MVANNIGQYLSGVKALGLEHRQQCVHFGLQGRVGIAEAAGVVVLNGEGGGLVEGIGLTVPLRFFLHGQKVLEACALLGLRNALPSLRRVLRLGQAALDQRQGIVVARAELQIALGNQLFRGLIDGQPLAFACVQRAVPHTRIAFDPQVCPGSLVHAALSGDEGMSRNRRTLRAGIGVSQPLCRIGLGGQLRGRLLGQRVAAIYGDNPHGRLQLLGGRRCIACGEGLATTIQRHVVQPQAAGYAAGYWRLRGRRARRSRERYVSRVGGSGSRSGYRGGRYCRIRSRDRGRGAGAWGGGGLRCLRLAGICCLRCGDCWGGRRGGRQRERLARQRCDGLADDHSLRRTTDSRRRHARSHQVRAHSLRIAAQLDLAAWEVDHLHRRRGRRRRRRLGTFLDLRFQAAVVGATIGHRGHGRCLAGRARPHRGHGRCLAGRARLRDRLGSPQRFGGAFALGLRQRGLAQRLQLLLDRRQRAGRVKAIGLAIAGGQVVQHALARLDGQGVGLALLRLCGARLRGCSGLALGGLLVGSHHGFDLACLVGVARGSGLGGQALHVSLAGARRGLHLGRCAWLGIQQGLRAGAGNLLLLLGRQRAGCGLGLDGGRLGLDGCHGRRGQCGAGSWHDAAQLRPGLAHGIRNADLALAGHGRAIGCGLGRHHRRLRRGRLVFNARGSANAGGRMHPTTHHSAERGGQQSSLGDLVRRRSDPQPDSLPGDLSSLFTDLLHALTKRGLAALHHAPDGGSRAQGMPGKRHLGAAAGQLAGDHAERHGDPRALVGILQGVAFVHQAGEHVGGVLRGCGADTGGLLCRGHARRQRGGVQSRGSFARRGGLASQASGPHRQQHAAQRGQDLVRHGALVLRKRIHRAHVGVCPVALEVLALRGRAIRPDHRPDDTQPLLHGVGEVLAHRVSRGEAGQVGQALDGCATDLQHASGGVLQH